VNGYFTKIKIMSTIVTFFSLLTGAQFAPEWSAQFTPECTAQFEPEYYAQFVRNLQATASTVKN
jgi:hypothetical protein